ncbi:MAG: TerB family tellurite resistance protein [Nitrospira sp.]|nr:TerB family tellurite resistance protein [bacterium]MBL7048587.1 TerB family tellurite resistance protein [Nitrospira sp.]
MLSNIRKFYQEFIGYQDEGDGGLSEHSLQVATAALLVEMMRADSKITEEEMQIINGTIRSRFKLSEKEAASLMTLAGEKIWQATGYYEFTSIMNKGFTYQNKVRVVEQLWEVAYADAVLDKYEEHAVRHIADLMHVEHKDFIAAKLRVKHKLDQA